MRFLPGTNSELAAPICMGDELIGVLNIEHPKRSAFTERHVKIAEAMANLAALAIEKARSYDALESKVNECDLEINAAYKISEIAHNTRNLEDLYPQIHDIVKNLMFAENFYICLFDDETKTRSFPYYSDILNKNFLQDVPLEKGLSGHVIMTGEPLFGTKEILKKLTENGVVKRFGKPYAEFWIGAPLTTKNGTIGALAVYSYDKDVVYSKDDFNILQFVSNQIATSIERVRHQEELEKTVQRRTARLSAAYEISKYAYEAKKVESLYPKIHQEIKNLMYADHFYIMLYDENAEQLELVYFTDQQDKDLPLDRILAKGLTGHVIKTGQPILASPEEFDKLVERGEVEKIGTDSIYWLGVPLKMEEKILGVLAVKTFQKELKYTEADKDILVFVSEQIAFAIERIKALNELEKRVEERTEEINELNADLEKKVREITILNARQKALIDLAQEMTSSIQLDKENIFQIIKAAIESGQLMEMANMFIGLYDKDEDFVYFPVAYKNGKPTSIPSRIAGGGRSEYIIKTKKSMLCQSKQEADKWYNLPNHQEYMGDPLASFVGVPMMVRDEVIGVVATYHPEQNALYGDDDLEILQAMANIAAIALENAKYIKELKDAQDEIADRERELVISGLAMDFIHKMNNLAGAIPPWISLIERRLDSKVDPKVIDYLDKILRDTRLMLKEANELKNNSPIEECFDVSEIIGSIIGQLEMIYPTDIEFAFDCDEDLFRVCGIKDHLSVAIYSVLQNSIKAIEDKGAVDVRAKNLINDQKKSIEIYISDTGCGIQPYQFEDVFEYGISLWDEKGMGYGLWRARSIIKSMKGTIELDRKRSINGATFQIVLPAVERRTSV